MSRAFHLYLEDIVSAASAIEDYVEGLSLGDFRGNLKTVHAVMMNLEIISEAVKKLPAEIKGKHPEIPWQRISGLRDRTVHEYFNIQVELIWTFSTENVPALKTVAQALLEESRE